ncbi:aminoglycoside phosphotransferase family protein [Marinilactibacillus psychrotolerans]|uniref:aminoglycoside phosphotransferase family protein n=1 Tax=Marinilactibacillus psychrotolerans TaxID=191770 RepID=UPI00382E5A77
MSKISEEFLEIMIKTYGKGVNDWVQKLPDLISECEHKFGIKIEKSFDNLSYNYVAEGTKDDRSVVLKLSFLKEDLEKEVRVLKAFQGRSVVEVIEYDEVLGALLMEQVVPGNALTSVGNDQEEVEIFCQVFEDLHSPKLKVTDDYTSISRWFEGIKRYRKNYGSNGVIKEAAIGRAEELLEGLVQTTEASVLIHGDLHQGNILRDHKGEWKVIDPKGIVGDIHFETIQYLLNHIDREGDPDKVLKRRIKQMSDCLNLDKYRIVKWGIVRGILEACWAIENGNSCRNGLDIFERFNRLLTTI